MQRQLRRQFLGLAGLTLVACADPPPADPAPEPRDIRLAVLVSVDQLRPDRLSESMPGGLGRMIRDGRTWVEAELEHAFTETCPGHAVMLTGRHPARIGIPANSYVDPDTLETRYCVEDPAPDAAIIGLRAALPQTPTDGRSPRIMKSSALGDWMKTQRPDTRVFSVAGKDRSAIAMGGLNADAAYWLARGPQPSWVTSAYYQKELPDWILAWRTDSVIGALPDTWRYLPEVARDLAGGARPDDYAHESPLLSRTQPHPLRRDPPNMDRLPLRARSVADRLYITPFADRVTLEFARNLVEHEGLGTHEGPDLLAIGLSATDLVGHFYGPESWESRDAITRLDHMLGNFFEFLDSQVGEDQWVAVLTADHGVLPVPEWIQEQGRSQCPVPGGRVDPGPLGAQLEELLDREFPQAAIREDRWFGRTGGRFTLNRRLTGGNAAIEARVLAIAVTFFEGHPGIERVWTRQEVLAGEGPQPLASYHQNSWVPDLAGDLALQVAEDCLLGGRRLATSHGSPYRYDRAVPLIFMGPDIESGKIYEKQASPVDIAPTLAEYLKVPAPLGLDGKVLPLNVRPPGEAGKRAAAEGR